MTAERPDPPAGGALFFLRAIRAHIIHAMYPRLFKEVEDALWGGEYTSSLRFIKRR
jgi:hypothetical protein